MTLAHLFAHCEDALCVSEDTAVAFFAPKTLKKFRVERFSGARVAGLYIQRTGKFHTLHVVDAEGNWFVVAMKDITLTSSATLQLSADPSLSTSAGSASTECGKPVVSARRTLRHPGGAEAEAASSPTGGIQEAHFFEVDGVLRCVLLTAFGVQEVTLRTAATEGLKATPIITFPLALSDCVLAVSVHTGLVCVAQKGQRWLQYATRASREEAGSAQEQRRRILPIVVESLSCSPTSEAVAVGGSRGELVVFPTVTDTHFFSDHWHHTALTALSFTVDGSSLLTGARESTLLVWSLSSYTHRKITCNLGPIRCVVPSSSTGSTLLLACGVATLATVDLLQMRLQHAVEGIEWSSGHPCNGLVADMWMGQPAVILTGLPNVLRLCDPLTQQAVYSLHISSQMETIPSPPRHGIQFAGLLKEGRLLVTYESFGQTSLPSVLRFWVYDAARAQHVEAQTVYKPHDSEVLALQVDKRNSRVFTLSRDCVKCWEEVLEDPNDALRTTRRSWRNLSTSPSPSSEVASMALSADGSLCLVADDSVHVYGVADCRPGERWPEFFTLCQSTSTAALRDVSLFSGAANVQEGGVVVAARDGQCVYLWNLVKADAPAVVFTAPQDVRITALCHFTDDSVLVANSALTFTELSCKAAQLGKVVGEMKNATANEVLFMVPLPGQHHRIAVVDAVTGFRVLNVTMSEKVLEEVRFTGSGLRASEDADATLAGSLHNYFSDLTITENGAGNGSADEAAARLAEAARTANAGAWLKEVLQESAYTAPSMSSALTMYLQRRSGIN